jgi:hypothetical protein
MNDKPVAWRVKNKNGEWLYYDEALVGTEALYTHPTEDFEAGRQQGMKQERALWELTSSTQEIENERK